MDKPRMLSGSELVARGATRKVDGQLPQNGLKEVFATGSWLEQKQIQSALEARKNLIGVERIEKSGSLSHATWRDDLKLAEVTKQTGGHWQYIGHHIGKHLYLLPEETLFLIEINSLLLKHNEVTVSLQKAYALCLAEIPLTQYKVYASLSRLGYRVHRHKEAKTSELVNKNSSKDVAITKEDNDNALEKTEAKIIDKTEKPVTNNPNIDNDKNCNSENGTNLCKDAEEIKDLVVSTNEKTDSQHTIDTNSKEMEGVTDNDVLNEIGSMLSTEKMDINKINITNEIITEDKMKLNTGIVYTVDEFGIIRPSEDIQTKTNVNTTSTVDSNIKETSNNETSKQYQREIIQYNNKIRKLTQNISSSSNRDGFNCLQDFYKETIVDVKVPEEKYLPRNIFLHQPAYKLNVDVVRNQNANNISGDEMETDSLPRTNSNSSNATSGQNYPQIQCHFQQQSRVPYYRTHRPFYYRHNFRPRQYYFTPRWRVTHINPQQYIAHNYNVNMDANRRNFLQKYHFDTITHIVTRFRNGFVASATQIRALHSLVNTYNTRYSTHLKVTEDFVLVDSRDGIKDSNIVVVLDNEPVSKKRRLSDGNDKSKTNLEKLRVLAAKLKDLHLKNLATPRHRRVFSNAIKTYNKSFNADIYLDANFSIVDRKLVVLDSSDSDVVVKEAEIEKPKKKKKLRNPYSILRYGKDQIASTSRQDGPNDYIEQENQQLANDEEINDEGLSKYFTKAWLPDNEDFGRPEVCSRKKAQTDSVLLQSEYIHEFLKDGTDFENWKEIKLLVLKEIRGGIDIQKQQAEALSNDFMETESQTQPILAEGCNDLKSALEKLAIIPTNKEIMKETSLKIHFDVWNRDSQYKKTNPPKPNFRVVCYDESSFPRSNDVATLQAQYKDENIPTVFAFVDVTATISYLQINCIELPVFLPDDNNIF